MNVVDTKLADKVPVILKSPVIKELPVTSIGSLNFIPPAPLFDICKSPVPTYKISSPNVVEPDTTKLSPIEVEPVTIKKSFTVNAVLTLNP